MKRKNEGWISPKVESSPFVNHISRFIFVFKKTFE